MPQLLRRWYVSDVVSSAVRIRALLEWGLPAISARPATQDLQVLLTEFSHTCSMEISRPPDTSYNDLDTYNDTYRKCMDPNGSDLPGDYPLRPSSIATRPAVVTAYRGLR